MQYYHVGCKSKRLMFMHHDKDLCSYTLHQIAGPIIHVHVYIFYLCMVYLLTFKIIIFENSCGPFTRMYSGASPLTLNDPISVWLGQYHGCWCTGSLRRQDISSHDIDCVEYVSPCLTWGRILSTCVISMWSNDLKCKYIFMFPLKNLARKGLICQSLPLCPWSSHEEYGKTYYLNLLRDVNITTTKQSTKTCYVCGRVLIKLIELHFDSKFTEICSKGPSQQ